LKQSQNSAASEFHSKVITGYNRLVALHLSQQVGLSNTRILTGPDLRRMSDEALLKQVNEADVFAEVEPNQEERIILYFISP
jgi:Mg2+-importing ATPase